MRIWQEILICFFRELLCMNCIILNMNDTKFFIISGLVLIIVITSAIASYDYVSMGTAFFAMAFCYWYIKNRETNT